MDFNQLLNDPTLCTQLQAIDWSPLLSLAGVTLFPVVRQLVQYFKEQWPVTKNFAPLLANVFGIVGNVGVGSFVGLPLSHSALLGLFTGLLSIFYHDLKKPNTPTNPTVVNVSN